MMVTIAVTALTNLAANLFLIPRLGMEGAAISMLITLIVAAMARGSALYRLSGIHPLERNYVKSLLISFPVILGCQAVLERIAALEAWMLPILLVMYTVLYGFCMILARSVDQEDIWMLMTVEKKLGVEFVLLKSFLKRFMK